MNPKSNLRIVGVAIIMPDKMWTLPPPYRHGDLIFILTGRGYKTPITGQQGFVTSDGKFIDRENGLILARKNGQLLQEYNPKFLFSEDLW